MTRLLLAAVALLCPAAAAAQIAVPRSVNPAAVAQKSDVQAVADAASAAQASAAQAVSAAAAARAAADAACRATPAVPPAEMIGGAAGSAGTSCRPSDSAQPRITRASTVTTTSAGAWSVTWSTSLAAKPVTLPIPINATDEPVVCNVATTSMTGATGRCWYARTLPATLVSLGALLNFDIFGAPAAGISVQVLAIPPTQ